MGSNNNIANINRNKRGSIWSIFMHADAVDCVLMLLGFIGAVGDGLTLPLTLVVTSKLMNNIGGSSNLSNLSSLTTHINQVCSSFFFLSSLHDSNYMIFLAWYTINFFQNLHIIKL